MDLFGEDFEAKQQAFKAAGEELRQGTAEQRDASKRKFAQAVAALEIKRTKRV